MKSEIAQCGLYFDRLRELGYPICETYQIEGIGWWVVAHAGIRGPKEKIKQDGKQLAAILQTIIYAIEHQQEEAA